MSRVACLVQIWQNKGIDLVVEWKYRTDLDCRDEHLYAIREYRLLARGLGHWVHAMGLARWAQRDLWLGSLVGPEGVRPEGGRSALPWLRRQRARP